MKVKIIIEELISQKFEVEVSSLEDAYDEIRRMYKEGKIVVEDPTVIDVNVNILEKDGEHTDWINLHV